MLAIYQFKKNVLKFDTRLVYKPKKLNIRYLDKIKI